MEGLGREGFDPRYIEMMQSLSRGEVHACKNGKAESGFLQPVHVLISNYPIKGIPLPWSPGEGRTRYKSPAIQECQNHFHEEVRELLSEKFGWTDFPLMKISDPGNFNAGFGFNASFVFRDRATMREAGDLTNIMKCLEDSMTGLLWKDDSLGYVKQHIGTAFWLPMIDEDTTFISFTGVFPAGKNKPPPDKPAPGGSGGSEPSQGGGLWTPAMN